MTSLDSLLHSLEVTINIVSCGVCVRVVRQGSSNGTTIVSNSKLMSFGLPDEYYSNTARNDIETRGRTPTGLWNKLIWACIG